METEIDIMALESSHLHALTVLLAAKTKAEVNWWATQRIDHAVSHLRSEHRKAMEHYFADPEPIVDQDLPF